jgi:hypothetical protein
MRNKISTAWRLLRTDRGRLAAILRGDVQVYFVHGAELDRIPAPERRADLTFRELTESDLRQLAAKHPDLDYQKQHLDAVGRSSAYCVESNGRIAHICWMMTRELEARLPQRIVGLGSREVEIGKAFTFPEFRGKSIYQFAIRQICAVARVQGFQSVFMITTWGNKSSRRGIEKAGLSPCGRILVLLPPVVGTIFPLIFRRFRRNRRQP